MSQGNPGDPNPIDPTAGRPPVDLGQPLPPPPPPPRHLPPPYPPPPPRPHRGRGLLIVLVILLTGLLAISLLANLFLGVGSAALMSSGSGPVETTYQSGDSRQRIVILPVDGLIDDSQAQWVHDALASLRDRTPKPAAVVLRVDSPGGGVGASDRIWHELIGFRDQTRIPVVVSMGTIAASGGYYISSMADHIVAERTTITGSIGVIAQAFTFDRLLDKVGVTPQTHHSTNATMKDVLNPMRPWTDKDVALLTSLLDDAQIRFEEVVSKGRAKVLKPAEVKTLANGAPLTAEEALKVKLIDEIGYLDAALAKAKGLAGIPAGTDPKVTTIHPQPGLLSLLGASSPRPAPSASLQGFTGEQARHWMAELSTPRLEYRWSGQ